MQYELVRSVSPSKNNKTSATSKDAKTKSESPEGDVLVSGEILFDQKARAFSGATIYVRLQDVSRADAPSKTIAEQVIRDVSSSKAALKFSIRGKIENEQASYIVSVHVDVDGDKEISVGDYITMESYPFSPSTGSESSQEKMSVRVQEVT
jgi:uncharacterized lipoprotein YbaY